MSPNELPPLIAFHTRLGGRARLFLAARSMLPRALGGRAGAAAPRSRAIPAPFPSFPGEKSQLQTKSSEKWEWGREIPTPAKGSGKMGTGEKIPTPAKGFGKMGMGKENPNSSGRVWKNGNTRSCWAWPGRVGSAGSGFLTLFPSGKSIYPSPAPA